MLQIRDTCPSQSLTDNEIFADSFSLSSFVTHIFPTCERTQGANPVVTHHFYNFVRQEADGKMYFWTQREHISILHARLISQIYMIADQKTAGTSITTFYPDEHLHLKIHSHLHFISWK